MINLLPPSETESIHYARRNSHLLKWLFALSLAIIGIIVIVGAGQLIIDRTAQQVASQVETGQAQLKAQKLEETHARVEEISGSLKLATQVLSRQVVLSELIPKIGAALPNGTALSSLQLNKLEGGLDLSVSATDYQTATQVQVNLEDEDNKIFQKADINNIDCAGNPDDPRYPCTAMIRALFAEDNPFKFLNKASEQ